MRHELGAWFEIMRNGSPPRPGRAPADSHDRTQLPSPCPSCRPGPRTTTRCARSAATTCSPSCRPPGRPRHSCVQGLRSIFRILKGRKLVFINPTARIRDPSPPGSSSAASTWRELRAALDSPDPPGPYWLRCWPSTPCAIDQVCALRLTDVRDGRLYICEQVILLAGPVRQRLGAWLDHRDRDLAEPRVNPYLFIHVRNAGTRAPRHAWWIRQQLGMSGQHIRLDRIFDEAHATGGDIRALCDLFGLSVAGAYRYAAVLDRVDFPARAGSREPVAGAEVAMSPQVTAALLSSGAALFVALLGIAGAIAAQLVATRRAFATSLALFERERERRERERVAEARREDEYRFAEQRRSTYARMLRAAADLHLALLALNAAAEGWRYVQDPETRDESPEVHARDEAKRLGLLRDAHTQWARTRAELEEVAEETRASRICWRPPDSRRARRHREPVA